MCGYELEEAIVDLGMQYFGLKELKNRGTLKEVHFGDALKVIEKDNDDATKYDLIIVDLFDDQSHVMPELLDVKNWENIAKRLKNPGKSRVICNLSTGRGHGANVNNAIVVAELIAQTCDASGALSIWPSGSLGVWNEVCLSGENPTFSFSQTPKDLAKYVPHFISTRKQSNDGDYGWLLDRLSKDRGES